MPANRNDGWPTRAALDATDAVLRDHLSGNHGPQLKSITREDKEMFANVEAVAAGDEKSVAMLDKLLEWSARLATATERVGPDEGRLEVEYTAFIEQGLDFVIHVRKQELALTTWLLEAFNRERGPGD